MSGMKHSVIMEHVMIHDGNVIPMMTVGMDLMKEIVVRFSPSSLRTNWRKSKSNGRVQMDRIAIDILFSVAAEPCRNNN